MAASGTAIVPGTGFTGPPPPDKGQGPQGIIRFNCVPHQKFTANFNIGVLAFHKDLVRAVTFQVEGGAAVHITTVATNSRTGYYEWYATLQIADFSTNKEIEVRATVRPIGANSATPTAKERTISIKLFAEPSSPTQITKFCAPFGSDSTGDGTAANPFRSIQKAAQNISQSAVDGLGDGHIVSCAAGDYAVSPLFGINTSKHWLTIQPDTGVARDQVRVTFSSSGLQTKLSKYKDLTIKSLIRTSINQGHELWLDGVHLEGNTNLSPVHSVGWFFGFAGRYLTGAGLCSKNQHGPKDATLIRGWEVKEISDDSIGGASLALDLNIHDVTNASTGHADVIMPIPTSTNNLLVENRIYYRVKSFVATETQPIYFGHNVGGINKDIAIINCLLRTVPTATGGSLKSQMESRADHVLMINNSLVEHTLTWRYQLSGLTNFRIEGNVYNLMNFDPNEFPAGQSDSTGGEGAPSDAGTTIVDNHYIVSTGGNVITPGTDVTTGDAGFVNAGADDFSPASGSTLESRMSMIEGIDDDLDGNDRAATTACGCYRGPAE